MGIARMIGSVDELKLEAILEAYPSIVEGWADTVASPADTVAHLRKIEGNSRPEILSKIDAELDNLSSQNIISFLDSVSRQGWHKAGRPSLTGLAHVLSKKMGICEAIEADSYLRALYHALILCALRVEAGDINICTHNHYHNIQHFMDVTLMTACLINHHNKLYEQDKVERPRLSFEQATLTMIAAIIHDLDHPGKGNPKHNPVYNEMRSSLKAKFILEACGLEQEKIHIIHRALLNTSPNLSEKDHYKMLESDIVEDADLSPSSGWGHDMWAYMSEKLTQEVCAASPNSGLDFKTPQSGLWFFDNIIGRNGYKSEAAIDLLGEHLEALKNDFLEQVE